MDVVTASEIDRRAWAVEQAVKASVDRIIIDPGAQPVDPLVLADHFLAYLHKPLVEADARLLTAARGYDGTQDAGNLIGLLADALERR